MSSEGDPETPRPLTGRAVLHPMELVDNCLRIDLRELGLFKHPPGSTWTITQGGLRAVCVRCYLSRDAEGRFVFYIANESWDGSRLGEYHTQEAPLESTWCAVRGRQWWFWCPRCTTRCRVLYRPPREPEFGCVSCHRLTYRSRAQHRSHFYEMTRLLDTLPRIQADLQARYGSRRRLRAMYKLLPGFKAL